MKDEIKQQRLAKLLGIEYVPPVKETPAAKVARENISREAESVIAYLDAPQAFSKRPCRVCKQVFAVNRANISCCSDTCRTELLSDIYGLDIDLSLRTPEDRWNPRTGGHEPLLVVQPILASLPVQDQTETA